MPLPGRQLISLPHPFISCTPIAVWPVTSRSVLGIFTLSCKAYFGVLVEFYSSIHPWCCYLIRRNLCRIFEALWQVHENLYARKLTNFIVWKKKLQKSCLANYLREIARKLVPNFELLWKVRENKSAHTKCAKICPGLFRITPLISSGTCTVGFLYIPRNSLRFVWVSCYLPAPKRSLNLFNVPDSMIVFPSLHIAIFPSPQFVVSISQQSSLGS